MDIVCKEKHNVIFWRNTPAEEWSCEDLDVMVNTYEDLFYGRGKSYTELEYCVKRLFLQLMLIMSISTAHIAALLLGVEYETCRWR